MLLLFYRNSAFNLVFIGFVCYLTKTAVQINCLSLFKLIDKIKSYCPIKGVIYGALSLKNELGF